METLVRTPQQVFLQPQRLIVPLFQRPYVWNEENQWAPLWGDLTRLAGRLLANPNGRPHPHFLGAVVLQQVQNPTGSMQERTVIDGQQRLTTLQLLIDALHAELAAVGAEQAAMRLDALVTNPDAFQERPQDRFKVWPTNRDRPAFNEVMSADPPVDHDSLNYRTSRLAQAHRYFSRQARAWLSLNGPEGVEARATAIERAVAGMLQLVVIDLTVDENAQEIFETLNARGAQLTAADLIKNFIFQRLLEADVDVEEAYEQSWQEFETGFWEAEVSSGRIRYSRSSIFLNHWLIAQTGEEIVAREVFTRFKRFADDEAGTTMVELLDKVRRAAAVYRQFVEATTNTTGAIDRLGLFAYRTGTLESEVFKPLLLLLLLDPEQEPVPADQLHKALETLESWLVRRMLVRATTSSYTQTAAELVTQVRKGERAKAGDTVETFLRDQTVVSRYWPDDDELKRELRGLTAYTRLRRPRLRMVLEAVEDHRRGWKGVAEGLGGQRVPRGAYAIEHIMPRQWLANWPLPAGGPSAAERDLSVHRLGNLTLLTGRLNSTVSNGPWSSKRLALKDHDVLKLNMDLLDVAGDTWDDGAIRARTDEMIRLITEIWPVPQGHHSGATEDRPRHKVEVADLIGAGLLEPGATLYARGKHKGKTATVLPDGRIDVNGVGYSSPSGAAAALTGGSQNGWWFFLLETNSRRNLSELLHEYVDQTMADVDDEGVDDDGGDEVDGDAGDQDEGTPDAVVTQAPPPADAVADGGDLASEFHRAMIRVYERAKAEAGYNATYFIQMVSEMGGVAAAKRLVSGTAATSGFTELWKAGRLDLSVEAVVLQPQYRELFTDQEVRAAKRRLQEYGYSVDE